MISPMAAVHRPQNNLCVPTRMPNNEKAFIVHSAADSRIAKLLGLYCPG